MTTCVVVGSRAERRDVMGGAVDDDRKSILARRTRFVAAALAGIALHGCDRDAAPQVCLSATAQPRSLGDAAPSSFANDATPAPDAHVDTASSAATREQKDAETKPAPQSDAAKPAKPRRPRAGPCLIAPFDDDDDFWQ